MTAIERESDRLKIETDRRAKSDPSNMNEYVCLLRDIILVF